MWKRSPVKPRRLGKQRKQSKCARNTNTQNAIIEKARLCSETQNTKHIKQLAKVEVISNMRVQMTQKCTGSLVLGTLWCLPSPDPPASRAKVRQLGCS